MMKFELKIDGQEVGKGRPRFTKAGVCYTPTKTAQYERGVKFIARQVFKEKIKGPVAVEIDIFHMIPRSASKKQKEDMVGRHACVKPDIDNVSKIIFDSLNGIAYEDDKQVARHKVERFYAVNPVVLVRVYELEER